LLLFDEDVELPGRKRLKLQASSKTARIISGTLLLLRLGFDRIMSSFKRDAARIQRTSWQTGESKSSPTNR
jgi:hypothetical protein